MKNKKNYLVLILALLVTLIVAACGKQATPAGGENSQNSKTEANQPKGFQEYPIGDEKEAEGLKIAAVYFQPVSMEPADKAGLPPDRADIHLEADIAATPDNKYGFGVGEWVPYLTIKYRLKNLNNGQEAEGTFMPMNASDGPHYGANVKMPGAGKYELTYLIESPEKQDYLLHTDRETGVAGRFWKKPIEVKWEFNFLPRKW
ncbi:34 kDa membrane antigen precursor [Moorella thermoacetica]|uniref:34 kDa membrane antigen n=1 Tax=Neomoorella thermoacetica TaxID=1525 RepID=A0A1J5PAM3_NEOTH|nr:34 kDa membrane antigen precursor [Moorella thermoacetica]